MFRFYDLGGFIVSLRSIGKLIELRTYDATLGQVHAKFLNEHKEGYERPVVVDLNTGFIAQSTPLLTNGTQKTTMSNELENRYRSEGIPFTKHNDALWLERAEIHDDIVYQLLIAFLTHQVRGEYINKGLRAKDLGIKVKIQESYLGGWNIWSQNSGNKIPVQAIINHFIQD